MMARFTEDIQLTEGLAFHRDTIVEALHSSGNDASRLNLPFVTRPTTDALRSGQNRSPGDETGSVGTSIGAADSVDSTMADTTRSRRPTFLEDGKKVTFEILKEIANTPAEKLRQVGELLRTQRFIKLFFILYFF